MSYLGFPRLHFTGYFQADVSTVNNDPEHFNDAAFKSSYQIPGVGASNGWWNPDGSGYWCLRDCVVKSVWYGDGNYCCDTEQDPVVGMTVQGNDNQAPGRLVDLDPEQQMVSEIWGFHINLGSQGQANSFQANFDVTAFADLWVRFPGGEPDSFFSAVYQSTLSSIQWSPHITSRFLKELAVKGKYPSSLSIKFVVDGFDDDRSSPTFTWGRITGTIGPQAENGPRHFVAGRMLRKAGKAPVNFSPCRLLEQKKEDRVEKILIMDLGNSLPTQSPGGPQQDLGQLYAAIIPLKGAPTLLGEIHYLDEGWYDHKAGIEAFTLTDEQWQTVQDTPLGVVAVSGDITDVILKENSEGAYAFADDFVFRIDANDQVSTTLYAFKFGQPCKNQNFTLDFENSFVKGQVVQGPITGPPAGIPESALQFPKMVTTDKKEGKTVITLKGKPPGNPRKYIDGQVYGVKYTWEGITQKDYYLENPATSSNILNVLLWDEFSVSTPSWIEDIQPIFQQYANLYPVMKPIVDLSYYPSVVSRLDVLSLVFNLPVSDPNYMPVTRDLSTPKRKMIQEWLRNPIYMKQNSVKELRMALQQAVALEHATIPAYLCALCSIKPGCNTEVASLIRSIVIEEMLHMSLACNLLNAVGGSPAIDVPDFIPRYPGHMPAGLRPDLIVSLKKCSIPHVRDVFMSIEAPEGTIHPREHHDLTIGWFYNQIEEAFNNLQGEKIFTGDPKRQIREWEGTGEMIPVTDLDSALAAINEIVKQGEGTSPINPEDGYDELAHYYKFEEIVRGRRIVLGKDGYDFTGSQIPFDPEGVYPMMDNPNINKLPADSAAHLRSQEFNQAYANLLKVLHQAFNGEPARLNEAIGMMFSLSVLGRKLMQTPVAPDSIETAGPAFQYPGY